MAERAVLAVDVGGSHVKFVVRGVDEPRRFTSGPKLSAASMVEQVLAGVDGWAFDVVSVGIPAQVHGNRVVHEPVNLGTGWAAFDYEQAFGRPTKVANDAALQAIGSYDGGRMLFLGLGTGLGSTMIVDGAVEPMELGHLPWRKQTYEDYVGARGRERLGRKRWEKAVFEVVEAFRAALEPDYIVLGGGEVKELKELPPDVRRGENANAFRGGFLLWDDTAGFTLP
jgi:predicted NBD/HSP70 family sugar kinase